MAHATTSTAPPAACSGIDANVLTSSGCPTACAEYPCVLYAPNTTSPCRETQHAGPCLVENRAVDVPGKSAVQCTRTYQCLRNLVTKSESVDFKVWSMALTPSAQGDNTTMSTVAPVTVIRNFSYPRDVDVVQIYGDQASDRVVDVRLDDDSIFNTPSRTTTFEMHGLNLETRLATVDFRKPNWTTVYFDNCNLREVPTGLATLAQRVELKYLIVSRNHISTITDATPFRNVTGLFLDYNRLTDLPITLPSVQNMELSGNPFTKIPDSIYSMNTLQSLTMRRCNITSINVTEAQHAFLADRIKMLDIDRMAETPCGEGYTRRRLWNSSACVGAPPMVVAPPLVSAAPPAPPQSSSHHSMALVGLIIGAVVVMAVGAFVWRRRRHRRDSSDYIKATSHQASTRADDSGSSLWTDPDLVAHRIEYDAVKCLERLSSSDSTFDIWRGRYTNQDVAVQRLRSDQQTPENAMAFAATAKIVARLEHPRIVRCIGVAWTSALPSIEIVTEWMEGGTLKSLLLSPRSSSLTWASPKLQIAIDVAEALVYLHSFNPKLLHRDLTARHVFLSRNLEAKLSSFASARLDVSEEQTMTAGVGTGPWVAPEVLLGQRYTESVDIYAFGALLAELDTPKTPLEDENKDASILQRVAAGNLAPSFSPSCPESIVMLARQCLSLDPLERPTALAVAYRLRQIRKQEF